MKVKDPTGRLARWALQLQQYDFEIIHCPGTQNGAADALSRRSYPPSIEHSPISLPVAAVWAPLSTSCQFAHSSTRRFRSFRHHYVPRKRQLCQTMTQKLDHCCSPLISYYLDEKRYFYVISGVRENVNNSRYVLKLSFLPLCATMFLSFMPRRPKQLDILVTLKTYEKVRQRYYWHGMFKDIEHWCRTCIDCAMRKAPSPPP